MVGPPPRQERTMVTMTTFPTCWRCPTCGAFTETPDDENGHSSDASGDDLCPDAMIQGTWAPVDVDPVVLCETLIGPVRTGWLHDPDPDDGAWIVGPVCRKDGSPIPPPPLYYPPVLVVSLPTPSQETNGE